MSRRLIVLCVVAFLTFTVVVGLTALYLSMTPKKYEATSVVLIPPTSDVATEMEIIKGQNLAECVIEKLKPEKREESRDRLVSKFRDRLKLEFRDRREVKWSGSSELIEIPVCMIEITATGDSPRKAKDIANRVAEEYVVLSLRTKHKLIPWNQKLWDDLVERIADELEQARADLERSKELLHEHMVPDEYMLSGVPHAVVGLKAGILQMEVELDILRERLSESDPEVINLKECIVANRQKLQQQKKKAIEQYSRQLDLTQVAAEAMFGQQLHTLLTARQERLRDGDILPNAPMIIDVAKEPSAPSRPRTRLTLFLSAVLGLSLSSGMVLFLSKRI
jgi:uncharacterized protein involved in exopolysaccharide biosynthesis